MTSTPLRTTVEAAGLPDRGGRPVHDAVTGEEIALVSSAGVDFARCWSTAPGGRPALRELTFHSGRPLKALAGYLPSTATSSTRCPRAPAPRCSTEVRR